MRYSTMTRKDLQKLIDSKEIRNVSIHGKSFTGECKCSRCGGTGQYLHYGVCFKCGGTGVEDCSGTLASEEEMEKQRLEAEQRAKEEEKALRESFCTDLHIKDWFLAKIVSEDCKLNGFRIIGETPKAYKVHLSITCLEDEYAYCDKDTWIPKSCFEC